MDTPPGTTLSTPSPTELQDKDPVAAEAEKSDMLLNAAQRLRPIYLVVATTPCIAKSSAAGLVYKLGIGLNGKLPWPSIKADMKYFKDVTQNTLGADSLSTGQDSHENTVIMGRKTYFSIPPKFRPLSLRQNVIITRSSQEEVASQIIMDLKEQSQHAKDWILQKYGKIIDDATMDSILQDPNSQQWKYLQMSSAQFNHSTIPECGISIESSNDAISGILIAPSPKAAVKYATEQRKGHVFCIGGAEVYGAFLADPELRPRLRILQTEIDTTGNAEFQCDTFWPEDLQDESKRWEEVKGNEIIAWTGVNTPQAGQEWHKDEKVNVRLRVRGWEQRNT